MLNIPFAVGNIPVAIPNLHCVSTVLALFNIVENIKDDDTNDFPNEVTGLGLTCATALYNMVVHGCKT